MRKDIPNGTPSMTWPLKSKPPRTTRDGVPQHVHQANHGNKFSLKNMYVGARNRKPHIQLDCIAQSLYVTFIAIINGIYELRIKRRMMISEIYDKDGPLIHINCFHFLKRLDHDVWRKFSPFTSIYSNFGWFTVTKWRKSISSVG